jgi:hypothetical protein
MTGLAGLLFGLEGLQVLFIALALIIATLFLVRYLSFYSTYRRVRRENLELARHVRRKLKTAKLGDFKGLEGEDELFKEWPAAKAKPLVIPATYEARIGKTARKKRSKAHSGGKAAKPPSVQIRRSRARRKAKIAQQAAVLNN